MNNELSTSITLLAAQNAGGDGTAFAYSMMAPGAMAAIFVVLLILIIGLLWGLLAAITERND